MIPVCNRSGARLRNCLRSLRWQRSRADGAQGRPAVEILVSDLGSDDEHRRSIDELAATYAARVIRSAYRGAWNRSLALNIGIRAARSGLVMCTDADMIFRDDFVAGALEVLRALPTAFVVCRCHDLPEVVGTPALTGPADLLPLLSGAVVRRRKGTGACQIARRSFFEAVRGYDEGFVYWGAEDRDMYARAVRYGLIPQWLDRHTAMVHQWHPQRWRRRRMRVKLNRWRFRLTSWRVVKNRRRWGEV